MQLFISTYGAYVHVRDQMFEIKVKKDGKEQKHLFSAKKIQSIILSQSTALSSDAVKLAMYNNIDIVFVENDGTPLGRVWHSKPGSTVKIRKAQLEASMNKTGVKWIKEWIDAKIQNQINFLRELRKHRPAKADFINEKIDKIEAINISLSALEGEKPADIAPTIRGLEGTAGRLYFETLSQLLAKEYRFNGRSKRPAADTFNAFLNYGYGVLYSLVEKRLIIAGLDPYVGFLHRDDYNLLSFVFDFIEPYRIYAEKTVYRLFSGKRVNQQHTTKITNGFSLNQQGKALLMEAYNRYLYDDSIRYRGRNQTRGNCIQMDAHKMANSLIDKNIDKITLQKI